MKWSLFFLALLSFRTSLLAEEIEKKPAEYQTCPPCIGLKAEAGVTYFLPESHLIRKIYGGGANYYITFAQKLSKHWEAWGAFNYFSKNGHSLGDKQSTSIKLYPFSLGFKYLFPFHSSQLDVDLYLQGAFKYYFLRINNHSQFVEKYTSKEGLGGIFGIGTYLHVYQCFYIDVLINYSFKRFHEVVYLPNTKSQPINAGGWDFGGGIGYSF